MNPDPPDAATLIAELKDQDATGRLRAAYQLGELRPPEVVAAEALIQAIEDPDPQVRIVVSCALGKIGLVADRVAQALATRLGDDNWQVRYSSARALGNLGTPAGSALPGLLDRLKNDEDENVRSAAAQAIARIGPKVDALPALMQSLGDDNRFVRHHAGLALKQLGAKTLVTSEAFQSRDWNLRSRVIDLLSEMGQAASRELASLLLDEQGDLASITVALIRMIPESTPFLEAALEEAYAHEDWAIVGLTRTALGYAGKAALPTLIAALSHTDDSFHSGSVATALARIGPDAIPALVAVLRGGNEQAASGAAAALDIIGTAIIPYVLPLLEDEDDTVRLQVVRLLGRVGSAAADDIADLAKTLEAKRTEDRQATIATLQEIGRHQDKAVLALVSVLQNGTPAIQNAAADSLARFGPAGRPAVPALVQALSNGDGELRVTAARALGSLDGRSTEVYSALVAASQDQEATALRKEAVKALGGMGAAALHPLVEATSVPDGGIDLAAIEAIGELGSAAYPALPELTAILKNGQPSARKLAALTLGAIGPAAMPEIFDAFQNEQDGQVLDAVVDALVRIGPTAVPRLVAVLESQDPEAVARAVGVLSRIGAPAVPGLILAMRTEDTAVRIDILKALHGIHAPAFAGFEIALQDEDEQVRSEAVRIMTRVYRHKGRGSGLAVKETVPFLASALLTGDQRSRMEAMEALALTDPNAVNAVPALVGALQDMNQDIRSHAAMALRRIGPPAAEAAPALGRALDDSASGVRQYAAQALRAIGPLAASAASALVAALQRETDLEARRSMIEALTAVGPSITEGIPLLVEALHDPRLRRTAAEALGNAGASAAPALLAVIQEPASKMAPELAEALHGINNDLRRSAAYALLLNAAATKSIADDLVVVIGDEREDAYVRSMVAAALEHSGQSVADFWARQGVDSPLCRTCPLGEELHLSGGQSFDIYDQGCNYTPGPRMPSIAEIFEALVALLTGR